MGDNGNEDGAIYRICISTIIDCTRPESITVAEPKFVLTLLYSIDRFLRSNYK